jgi:hypothetical protein
MGPTVKSLLEAFDALSEAERHEAAVEILRRISPRDAELTEQANVEVADAAFAMLDAEEAEAVNADCEEG